DGQIAWILSKMIAKEPEDRYQSCHELVADLEVHPLVAKSGPITIVPKISAAAATMIGQRTPVANAPMANTRITPSAQPMPPAQAPAAMAGPADEPFERRSVLDRPTHVGGKRSSPVLAIAIAAALVLCLVGGAWAFRDMIPGLGGGASDTVAIAD